MLFSAASYGGAYGGGRGGAHGRVAAWRSLAALTGTDGEPATVEHAAAACTWLVFEAPTSWYAQVAWDIGIAALRPDRTTVAVLAATDED